MPSQAQAAALLQIQRDGVYGSAVCTVQSEVNRIQGLSSELTYSYETVVGDFTVQIHPLHLSSDIARSPTLYLELFGEPLLAPTRFMEATNLLFGEGVHHAQALRDRLVLDLFQGRAARSPRPEHVRSMSAKCAAAISFIDRFGSIPSINHLWRFISDEMPAVRDVITGGCSDRDYQALINSTPRPGNRTPTPIHAAFEQNAVLLSSARPRAHAAPAVEQALPPPVRAMETNAPRREMPPRTPLAVPAAAPVVVPTVPAAAAPVTPEVALVAVDTVRARRTRQKPVTPKPGDLDEGEMFSL